MTGVGFDKERFLPGGRIANAFSSADPLDVWPRPKSVLIGAGVARLAPRSDFNNARRGNKSVDVGAYETGNLIANPGWKIMSGPKQSPAKRN